MARARGSFGDIRTSPRNQRLLKWLRRKPQPHTVIGETADGEEHRCTVSLTGPTQWSDVLSVVRPCIAFKALDKDGNTLRALELDPDDPELRAELELESVTRAAAPVAGSVPIISVDIPRLVDNLARNIREASSEAARQQAGAFRDGFTAMTNVVNLCLNMLQRVDQRMAEQEEDAAARAEEARQAALLAQQTEPTAPADQRQQLAMMALQRALSGGNGATPGNGAGMNMGTLMQLLQQFQQSQPPEGESNG
jgi:hypothetical protein